MKIVSLFISLGCCSSIWGFQNVMYRRLSTSSFTSVVDEMKMMQRNDDSATTFDTRRSFMESVLVTSAIIGTSVITSTPGTVYASDSTTPATLDYTAVAKDISSLITDVPDRGPTLVRLAWHSSGTYDKMLNNGGSNGGTIRFKEELDHGGNAGLGATAVQWLDPIYSKYKDQGLTYADLYTLGGVVAIKTMSGPTIPWSSGRVDAIDASSVTPDGRLPNADSGPPGADPSDAQHLRTIFNRMGFDDQEIVALSGAHALGRCHTTASGYDGPWTFQPTTWTNQYFTLLTALKWDKKDWTGPYQYVNVPGGSLMMLPTDLVLLQDSKFLKWVKIYSTDAKKFDSDFTKAFQKLEELGTSNLVPTQWA